MIRHGNLSTDNSQSDRLNELVDRALLKDLLASERPFALTLPEVDLEATVLNRLAVLEVLCKSQEHTIDVLQTENARLRSSLTASTSHNEVLPEEQKLDSVEYAANYASGASAFVPFKGLSYTVEGGASGTASASSFIPAVRQRKPMATTQETATVHSLHSISSALRPLQREEFLAKLPKAVIKGGRLLPIRSCIQAFLKGDESALQSALVHFTPDMQQTLEDVAQSLNRPALEGAATRTANEQQSSHGSRSNVSVRKDSSLTSRHNAAAMSADLQHQACCSHENGFSAKSYVTDSRLESEGTSEVLLRPPEAADVQRASHNNASSDSQVPSDAGQAAVPASEHDGIAEEAGCDQLVKYVLREILGGVQAN